MPSKPNRLPSQTATAGSLVTGTQSTTLPHARKEVVEKIRKCLARADHPTANETEAKVAMRMASKIMQQHNITQAQIMEDEDDALRLKRGGMSTVNIGTRTPDRRPIFETWVSDLKEAICMFFDCKAFSTRKRSSIEWTFYGVAEHTESAAMAFEMVHNLIQRWACPLHGVPARNSYRLGVAHGLRKIAKEDLEAVERLAEENERKSTAASDAPSSTPFQQPSVVEFDSDEDFGWSIGTPAPVQRRPLVEIDSDEDSGWSIGTFTPVQRPPVLETDSDEDSTWSTRTYTPVQQRPVLETDSDEDSGWSIGTFMPVQRSPILETDTHCQTPAELPRPASSVLKEQLMDLLPDAEDAITSVLSRYEIAWRESSTRGKFLREINERVERLERLARQAASQPSTPQPLQSAPATPPWQSAFPSLYLSTPPLRAGNKRRRADDDSGKNGLGQSEPAAKKGRLDDGICGHRSASIEKSRETDEGGYQNEDISANNSVLPETNEGGCEDIPDNGSVLAEEDEGGYQGDISDDDSKLAETDDGEYESEDISDDDSEEADFNDEDSDMLDVTAPFDAELEAEVQRMPEAKSAPSKDPITSEPTKVAWASSMQLTIYRENVAKIAEDVLKAHNIKLRAGKKRIRSVKDKKQYAQGVEDSKKIKVRGLRIEN